MSFNRLASVSKPQFKYNSAVRQGELYLRYFPPGKDTDSSVSPRQKEIWELSSQSLAFLKVEQRDLQSVLIQSNIFIHLLVPWWSVGGREEKKPWDEGKHGVCKVLVICSVKLQRSIQTVSILKATKHYSPVLQHCSQSRSLDAQLQ